MSLIPLPTSFEHPRVDERRLLWALLLFAAALRILFFAISTNGAGTDAAPRAIVAYEWSKHPVWITPGHWLPLQIWLSGISLWLWNNVWVTPRIISLIFGIATTWPFYKLVRQFFSMEVSAAATLLFALFGLHISQTVQSGGEALYFFFVFWALYHQARWWETLEPRGLVWAGLCWIPATLTRHEGWWLAAFCVLYAAVRAVTDVRRGKLLLSVVAFALLVVLGPALWMTICALAKGDPLLSFHRVVAGAGHKGQSVFYKVAFWPVGLTLTLGPLAVLLACAGVLKGLKHRTGLGLLAALLAFAGPFWLMQLTGRGEANIRHTMFVGMLLLPFAPYAIESWSNKPGKLARGMILVGAAWLLVTFALGETNRGTISQKFRSISPRPQDRPHVMDAATWVRKHAAETDRVVVDRFNDEESSLQFHVHLPPENVIICWDTPRDVRAFLTPPPRFIIAAPKGALGRALQFDAPEQFGLKIIRRHANDVYTVFEVTPSS